MRTFLSIIPWFCFPLLYLTCLWDAVWAEDRGNGKEENPPILRWAAATDSNVPFAFYNEKNELIGFEVDLIKAIAAEMGRKPIFVPNDWDGLIPGLGRGLYDLVICGIEITPEKEQEVAFSDPYYVTFEQYVNKKGSENIQSLEDLSGKTVGTLTQTAALAMLQRTPGVKVKIYTQEINAYKDVANGRIDGVLLDFPIAKYFAYPNPLLQFSGPQFGQLLYGIAMRKEDKALQQEVNAALRKVIQSGKIRDILSYWGLWTPTIAAAFGLPEEPSVPATGYDEFLTKYAEKPTFLDWIERYVNYGPLILQGTLVTLHVSILGMILAILLGFTLALIRVYGPEPLKWLVTLYVEIIRGTPLLVQLLFLFYGLPNIGIKLSPLLAGIIGLGLNYAAYEAENYRAGLLAIPRGQMEAAQALGMSQLQALYYVIIPQSFRLVLPPVTNDFISLLKDSSLVSMVTLLDLTGVYNRIATQTFDYFGTGIVIAVIYLLIGLPFVRLARSTEEKLAGAKKGQNKNFVLIPVATMGYLFNKRK
ncbi:MAG: ABC transporter substrate-binding protein/permease [Chthoniobacterales bacterium]|nr:ABC transporter substrate-binding protein/permease [Chthoniobacterales bacterium]